MNPVDRFKRAVAEWIGGTCRHKDEYAAYVRGYMDALPLDASDDVCEYLDTHDFENGKWIEVA